jgi:hypothetical protein
MAHSEVNDVKLVLVSARKSRGADLWDKDDYDVRLGDGSGPVVGRIMRHPQAPEEQPWFWTITAREQLPSVYNRAYAVSREQAMADFRRGTWGHRTNRPRRLTTTTQNGDAVSRFGEGATSQTAIDKGD